MGTPEEIGIKIKKIVKQILSMNPHLKTIEAIANFLKSGDSQTCKLTQF